MPEKLIQSFIDKVEQERMTQDLLYLCSSPLTFRKLNYTRPGAEKCSLYEADDYITAQLEAAGYITESEGVKVQAFRCDASKPKSSQYSIPHADDPWYTAYNLYARKTGADVPDETIVICSHKDSQSWVDSPGAYDNVVGTIANIEIARLLAEYNSRRNLCFLFCNEEHIPWTSATAAQNAAERGENIVAVFNIDSIGGKSAEAVTAGRKTNYTLYTTPEGKVLADLQTRVIEEYGIPLEQHLYERQAPGDDDGSFVKAGFSAAIANLGSYPYANPDYHAETDTADRVDMENVALATQAILAAIMQVDAQ